MKNFIFWIFIASLLCGSFFLGRTSFSFWPSSIISLENNSEMEGKSPEEICYSTCCNPDAPPSGRWHKRSSLHHTANFSSPEEMQKLQTLGYASGIHPNPENSGILQYDRLYSDNGFNLYNSGHAPEAILIDMEGKELHKWHYDIEKVWPKMKKDVVQTYWRRVHLFENGDLLAIYDGIGLIKLDKDSKLLWSYAEGAHHDLEVTPEGHIYVLTRKAHISPKYNKSQAILEDYIVILNANGQEIKKVSVLKALENSHYAPVLRKLQESGDILHTNTLELLSPQTASISPIFKPGRVLISILRLDLIAVVDLEEQKVVWGLSGMWNRQHQPHLLKNGRMLIYDNCGLKKWSRVLEFDPFTQEVFWEYRGSTETPFYSYDCGSSARLPNGNTLITETNQGRAFEVTPDKNIVWEFVNPYSAMHNQELIASLFEVIRIPANFPVDWCSKK